MISTRLKDLILKELELDEWEMDEETRADMIPGWDSLSHVKIITSIEDEYHIRFRAMDVMRLKNLGELQSLIDRAAG